VKEPTNEQNAKTQPPRQMQPQMEIFASKKQQSQQQSTNVKAFYDIVIDGKCNDGLKKPTRNLLFGSAEQITAHWKICLHSATKKVDHTRLPSV